MNVLTLTDVELNRAMVWLYPPKFNIDDYGTFLEPAHQTVMVCHLTDWNLTMPLAVEAGLTITTGTNGGKYRAGITEGIYATLKDLPPSVSYWSLQNKNPLRAICEVLVMIGMEK